MKIWPDCIPCILKMSLGVARVAMKDEDRVRRFMEGVLRLKYFSGKNQKVTPPDVIRDVWSKVIEVTGEADPLRKVKEEQNRKALANYPKAKALVLKSRDPFLGAVKLAIAANSIDAMTDVKGEAPEEIIKKWNRLEIGRKQVNSFKERVKKSRKVVYLGDNCGEIVFDKLFIEVLLEMFPIDITYVTRTLPIMNDATLRDALVMGMGEVAQIMENGVPEHFPGTFLKRIDSELKKLIERSDLVISKGGGNYDSLTEEEKLKGKTSFLFLAKCFPYCHLHHVSLNAPVIYNF
jgi:uncharacterized protein with ATP-grasp and redox domains